MTASVAYHSAYDDLRTTRRLCVPPILFVNIGWMKYYQGPSLDDPLNPGNFGYFKQKADRRHPLVGHEQWNFREQSGAMYGYVPREPGINLVRLGADRSADCVDGVLVVFMARDPVEKTLKVIGWYRDATVCRSARFVRHYGKTQVGAMITARADNCHRLSVADRNLKIPTAKKAPGGVGQSPVWYADLHPHIVQRVWALVENQSKFKPNRSLLSGGSPRNPDPERRLQVELRAMNMAMDYFDHTNDVSQLKLGWDIEATSDSGRVFIEVKGISGNEPIFELTPNEYKRMFEHRERYLLFVVTSALSHTPYVRIFRCRTSGPDAPAWVSEQGETLKVEPRTGARCST
jgi:Domain of unknown function (DUF3883)